ncbi:MAG: hypothetical protein Q4E45_09615 [Eubacteriales bacterium]|nr:hypothetical protein [Eubacteriales bacterium]
MNRKESCAGTINAVLLLLFLAGGVTALLYGDLATVIPVSPKDAALWAMGLILLADVLVCLTPLALALQPPLMFALGSAVCLAAQELLRGTAAGETGIRLLLLALLVPACFALAGRGLFNALLMIRSIRGEPGVLGRSVKHTCVPVLFGMAVLFLLCRFLRFL